MCVSKMIKNSCVLAAAVACTSLAQASGGFSHYEVFALDMIESESAFQSQNVQATPDFQGRVSLPKVSDTASSSFPMIILGTEGQSQSFGLGPIAGDTLDNRGSTQAVSVIKASIKPDSIAVVPLPSAAIAGMGLLCGIAGVRFMKSRRD